MKDVSIIIINYNSSDYTLRCVDSVLNKTTSDIDFEIVIVDNNSTDEDFENLTRNIVKNERIRIHRSDINLGFGGGNMFGTQFTQGKYLLFLNNDTLFLNNCLHLLCDFMEKSPDIGVSTAQNYTENKKFTPSFDHNKSLIKLLFGRGLLEKMTPERYPERKREYTSPLEADWINGAFMFFRAEAFEAVGGFDTNIFLYCEEMDICERLRRKSYKTYLFPKAKIIHYIGASTERSLAIKREYYISYLYMIKKNFGFLRYFLIRLYLLVTMLFKPKKWNLLPVIIKHKPKEQSLKYHQKPRSNSKFFESA